MQNQLLLPKRFRNGLVLWLLETMLVDAWMRTKGVVEPPFDCGDLVNGEPVDLKPAALLPRGASKKKDEKERPETDDGEAAPKQKVGLLSEEAQELLKEH